MNGTISGDFSAGAFVINGSASMQVYGDSAIEIVADADGFAIGGLNVGASLKVTAADTYRVNDGDIAAQAGDVIIGLPDGAGLLGDNVIVNATDNTLLTGTADADTIFNSGASVTILALGGDDFIWNEEANTLNAGTAGYGVNIAAGDGNDTVFNFHSYYPTITGGAGNDSIVIGNGHRQYIDGGAGSDTIIGTVIGGDGDWRMGGYATITGGDGSDLIDVGYSDNSSITGGDGDDTIIANGKNSTVDAGGGSNVIRLTTIDGGATGQFIVLHGDTIGGFDNVFTVELRHRLYSRLRRLRGDLRGQLRSTPSNRRAHL